MPVVPRRTPSIPSFRSSAAMMKTLVRLSGRPLAIGLVALTLVGWCLTPWSAHGQQRRTDGPPPGRDLLRDPPFDRLTLIDRTELIVDPVAPRPLPSEEELAELREQAAEAERQKKTAGIIIGRAPSTSEDPKERQILIRLQGEKTGNFYVKIRNIQKVDYFEDILLDEAERLASREQFNRAFDLILAVRARDPQWPGLDEAANRVLFLEGRSMIGFGRVEEGLRALGNLFERDPDYPELMETLGDAYSSRIEQAINREAFALGRRMLDEFAEIAPESPEIKRLTNRFRNRAERVAERAEGLDGPDKVEALVAALGIWPRSEAMAERYRTAFQESPVLDVAVLDVSRRPGPWITCEADRRLNRLLYLPILQDASEAAMNGERAEQVAEELQVGNIGRRWTIRVKPGIRWNDASREIAAEDVARALSDRALENTAGYDARWANMLDRVQILSDREVEVALNRAPMEPAAWLLVAVGPSHAGSDGLVWTPDGPQPIGSGPFGLVDLTNREARYDRAAPPADGKEGEPEEETIAIARVLERRLEDPRDAVAAMLRGEVALIEAIPPDRITELQETEGLQVGRYADPRLYWIAIDGRNPTLQNRSLRRGLSYALDRERILSEEVLGRDLTDDEALADGPMLVGSDLNAVGVRPLGHDALLAKMLVRAAQKEMGGDPIRLRFAYPATPIGLAAAPAIIEAFEEAGVTIDAVARPPSDLEIELRRGDRFELALRSGPVLEPVRDIGPTLCPGYVAPASTDSLSSLASTRILQLLLRLEQLQDRTEARNMVMRIDMETRDELPILPLWQLHEHYAWSERLTGPAEEADSLYDGLLDWTIEPWDPGQIQ